ncbi:hypothetical protein AB1286_03955 [Trinickia sp. NRRL B-1857]|uniref:hypothetical protein n=1 Tax=Trinickia sp. NRRL B-1857 TaxID=3162879 RepID=UPI003D2ADC80
MKLVIHAAGLLVCSLGIAVAQSTLARAQPTQPSTRHPPEMSAGWHAPTAPAPSGASAPRGNLRSDIESNARWNENSARPRGPHRR